MAQPSSSELNEAVVRRLVAEAWTGENLDLVDELVSPEYVEYAPFGEVRGIDGYKDGIRMFTTAFPDIELDVEEMIADGDVVAFRLSASATHEGPFMEIEPTGNDVRFAVRDFTRLDDGKVVEEWLSLDTLGLLEQLEAISSSEVPTSGG